MADEQPEVLRVANRFQQLIADGQAKALRDLARGWRGVERGLEEQIEGVVTQLAELGVPSEAQLYRLSQYQTLLAQVQAQISTYANKGAAKILDASGQDAIRLGTRFGSQFMQAVAPPGATLRAAFGELRPEAFENLLAQARGNNPLGRLLEAAYPQTANGITKQLLSGLARGLNPRTVAQNIVNDGLSQGLNHMMLVARDQYNRSARMASQQYYRANGIKLYKRLAAKQSRTCVACLVLDGETYEVDELMEVHPQDRCTMVPIVPGFPEVNWETGKEWLARQPDSVQRQIMGPGIHDLYRSGQIPNLLNLVSITQNSVWGPSARPASLAQLTGQLGGTPSRSVEDLLEMMRTGTITNTGEKAKQGLSRKQSYFGELEDGTRVFVKKSARGATGKAEEVAYLIARDFLGYSDLVPPTVMRGAQSVQVFIEGVLPHEYKGQWNEAQLRQLLVLDFITGNGDRHWGNIIVDPQGNLHAIDNDRGINSGYHSANQLLWYVQAQLKETTGQDIQLTAADIASFPDLLNNPDFENLISSNFDGGPTLWSFMRDRMQGLTEILSP